MKEWLTEECQGQNMVVRMQRMLPARAVLSNPSVAELPHIRYPWALPWA